MTCKYHDFKPIRDEEDAVVETCRNCHIKEIYKKRDGRIDNAKYLRDHVRDFCQPWGATKKIYLEIYGEAALKRSLQMRQGKPTESREDAIGAAKEDARIWERLSNRGHTEEDLQRHYGLQAR